jgi:hypothetical protein
LDIVESLFRDTKELDNFLMGNQELSLRVLVDSNFRKSILLASASYFERRVTDLIAEYAQSCTTDDRIICFLKNKALSRQYHTLLGLFGEEFKKKFGAKVSGDDQLDQSIKAFLEIGQERNRLVHQNFGSYSLEKTADEIHELHLSAKNFLIHLKAELY